MNSKRVRIISSDPSTVIAPLPAAPATPAAASPAAATPAAATPAAATQRNGSLDWPEWIGKWGRGIKSEGDAGASTATQPESDGKGQ